MIQSLGIMTDSSGVIYVTAEYRFLLYDLCDMLHMGRRAIRWSMDLRCHVLIVNRDKDKLLLRHMLKINDKGMMKSCMLKNYQKAL